jgi:hypothetical protein
LKAVPVRLSENTISSIERWQRSEGVKSRTEALRMLIEDALGSKERGKKKTEPISKRLEDWIEFSRTFTWEELRRISSRPGYESAIVRAAKAFGLDADTPDDQTFLLGVLAIILFPNRTALTARSGKQRGRPRNSMLIGLLPSLPWEKASPNQKEALRRDRKVIAQAWQIQDQTGLSFDKALNKAIRSARAGGALPQLGRDREHHRRLKRAYDRMHQAHDS